MRRSQEETSERLVRKLIELNGALCERGSAPPATASDEAEVLVVEVDGYQYRLMRRMATARPTTRALTPREMEIARMVAIGYANKTIAAVLEISSWTVATHLRHIFAKLGVATRAAMVAKMMRVADQPGGTDFPWCEFANEPKTTDRAMLSRHGALRKRAVAGGSSPSRRTVS